MLFRTNLPETQNTGWLAADENLKAAKLMRIKGESAEIGRVGAHRFDRSCRFPSALCQHNLWPVLDPDRLSICQSSGRGSRPPMRHVELGPAGTREEHRLTIRAVTKPVPRERGRYERRYRSYHPSDHLRACNCRQHPQERVPGQATTQCNNSIPGIKSVRPKSAEFLRSL